MAAANARPQVVVDYGPDPARRQVLGLAADIVARVSGRLVRPYAGDDFNPSTTYHGVTADAGQQFRGVAAPAAGAGITRDGGFPDIASGVVEGPHGEAARRVFASRLRRGRVL